MIPDFTEQFEIIEIYNEAMLKSQNIAIFTRNKEIQTDEIEHLKKYDEYLEAVKNDYIKEKNEKVANLILCLQLGSRAVCCELSMLVFLKDNEMEKAWNNLIEAQYLTLNVIRNHPTNGDYLLGYMKRLNEYETLLFPKMMFSSYGGIIKNSECSICGNDYGKCDHLKGKFYMGQMCCRIIKEVDLEEVSTVENPADKRCRVISYSDENGDNIDILTLKKSKKERI